MSEDFSTTGMTHDERVAFLAAHNSTLDGARESLRLTTAMAQTYADSIERMTAALVRRSPNPIQADVERAAITMATATHADMMANVEALTVVVARLEYPLYNPTVENLKRYLQAHGVTVPSRARKDTLVTMAQDVHYGMGRRFVAVWQDRYGTTYQTSDSRLTSVEALADADVLLSRYDIPRDTPVKAVYVDTLD